MQVRTLLFSVVLLIGVQLKAQEFYSGARFEIGQSGLSNVENSEPLIYLSAGAIGSLQYLPWLDLNAEALLAWQGGKFSGVQETDNTLGFFSRAPYDGKVRMLSLKIPLYPALNVGSEKLRFRVQTGPSINFNFFAREDRDYESSFYEDVDFGDFESYDPLTFSMVYGLGLRIKDKEGKWVFLDFRYSNGLSDLMNFEYHVDPSDARLHYFSISTGYLF